MLDEVPEGPVEVPPVPSVEADVPPAAAEPAVPMVPLPPDAAPLPMVDALGDCASATELSNTAPAAARMNDFISVLLFSIDRAVPIGVGDDGRTSIRRHAGRH